MIVVFFVMILNMMFYTVDCEWAEWSIGECSKPCGGGTQIDTRIREIKAANGGLDCNGPSFNKRDCNIHDCKPGTWQSQFFIFFNRIKTE